MFGVPYVNTYNPQPSLDRINNQISELEKMREQLTQQPIQQPTNLTQNFQLAPSNSGTMRYANSMDEVQRDMVIADTPFFSRDMSIVWIKNTKGEIRTYELSEIIPKDEKDMQIELLQAQVNELKGMINNESDVTNDDAEHDESSSTKDDKSDGTTTKKSKSTSI